MKKAFLILFFPLIVLSCGEDKLTITCNGDCDDFSYQIGDETGSVSASFTTNYTYDSYGSVSTISSKGTITYKDSGNTYSVKVAVNYKTCKYTVTVNDEYTCGN